MLTVTFVDCLEVVIRHCVQQTFVFWHCNVLWH